MRKAVNHLKKADPVLAAIIEKIGPCRMQFGEPTFHSLAESILYQQLNGTAAATIFKRFTTAAGDPLTPEGILKLSDAEMRAVGLSKQKTSYLRDLSEKTKAGPAGIRETARAFGSRSDRAPGTGQGHRGMDGAHVPDVHLEASGHTADGRLWHPGGDQEALQETQVAKARGDGKDRAAVGAVSVNCVLVFVAEPGCEGRS